MTQEQYKNQGNEAYQKADYRLAIYFFSMGLSHSSGLSSEFVLYSNRSASYCQLGDYQRALADAEMVIKIKPDWPKGYSRKAHALEFMKQYKEAITVYEAGLQLEPGNDVMSKGLKDCIEKKNKCECKGFDKTVAANTTASILRAQSLPIWNDVIWHLEITKERIWLEDGPKTPFRPRSIFLIDSVKLQIANVAPHCARDSITLDELLEFIVQSCFKHNIRPGTLEAVDSKLALMLRHHLSPMGLNVKCVPMVESKKKFLEDTFRFFDEQELQQWRNDPQYAGVLQQRAQTGLLNIEGVTLDLLHGVVSAANNFCRSKVYLYYTQGLGIRLESTNTTRVALVIRNAKGQYGLAMSSIEATENPQHYGDQAVMFVDLNELPFDDADLFEQQNWKVVEDRYPYPIVFNSTLSSDGKSTTTTLKRPSAEDLQWYEVALKSITLFVEKTFGNPTFMPPTDFTAKYRCLVYTSQGQQTAVISVPPNHDAIPFETLTESIHRPDEEDAFSVLASPSSSGFASPPAPSFQHVHSPPTNVESPKTSQDNDLLQKSQDHVQQNNIPMNNSKQSSLKYSQNTTEPVRLSSPTYNFESKQTCAVLQSEESQSFQSPSFSYSNDEGDVKGEIFCSPTSGNDVTHDNNHKLRSQLREAQEKIKWQAGLLKGQESLVKQLQSQIHNNEATVSKLTTRIEELEKMQLFLIRELQSKTKSELGEGRQLLKEFSTCALSLLRSEKGRHAQPPMKPSTGTTLSSTSRTSQQPFRSPSPRPHISNAIPPLKPNRLSSRNHSPTTSRTGSRPVTPPSTRRGFESDGAEQCSSVDHERFDDTAEESAYSRSSDTNRNRQVSKSCSIRKHQPSPNSGLRSPKAGSVLGASNAILGTQGKYKGIHNFGSSIDYRQGRENVINY